jgi:hypothetical protein
MMRRIAACLASILLAVIAAGCGSTPTFSTEPVVGPASSTSAVSIPVDRLPPAIQCMVDGGMIVDHAVEAYPGASPGYELKMGSLSLERAQALMTECKAKFPSPVLSDADIRVIYDRWVKERECLVGLGYRPMEPPTFEKFVADWRGTGPWDPLAGVDTNSWTDADYQTAKKSCTLEMFDRG